MPKVVRQIRLEPKVEDTVQKVAELESRTFSSTCNWLLNQKSNYREVFIFSQVKW